MPKIILASKSKNRKKLLEEAGIPFEVVVSNADETPIKVFSFKEQLNEIAMRKALTVMDMLKTSEDLVIVAADQNIVFNDTMYGKPESIEEARDLIKSMEGSEQIYAYVGNAILYISNSKVITCFNKCDVARLRMDNISDEELDNYLNTKSALDICGGVSITETPFLHLVDGKESTAAGMTIEYLTEFLSTI